MAIWNRLFGSQSGHTDDPIELILQRIESGEAVILDVRSQKERDQGFLTNSIFIPFDAFRSKNGLGSYLESLPKEKPIYCH